MSLFSIILRKFRRARGFTQNGLGILLGYEVSCFSSFERSEMGAPLQHVIQRLIRGLNLTDDEQAELSKALSGSKRQISLLPSHPSNRTYSGS